jgi:hypothetical protein
VPAISAADGVHQEVDRSGPLTSSGGRQKAVVVIT